jgi:DNA-binding NarL/FixJ family response regulator
MNSKTIYLIDDHPLLIEALKHFIQKSAITLKIVGSSANPKSAISECLVSNPDIVICDYLMPEMNGIEVFQKLKADKPEMKFILLTQVNSQFVLHKAWALGVDAIISKSTADIEINKAIESVLNSKRFLNETIKDIIFSEGPLTTLTARELEVIPLVAKGNSNKEIGVILNCSDQTIKSHKASILKKLNLNNSVEIAVWCIENKLFEPLE